MGNVLEQEIAEAASRYLAEKGYDLSVVLCHGSAERYAYLLQRLRAHPVDGALIVQPFAAEVLGLGREYSGLAGVDTHLVFVDRYPASTKFPVVTTHNRQGASRLVEALAGEGADLIVVLDNPEANMVQRERCSGYAAKSKELGIRCIMGCAGEQALIGIKSSKGVGFVASSSYPVARFSVNQKNALSGRRLSAGVFDKWSGDRSGFDALFVCRQDFQTMAKRAVDLLLGQIESRPVPSQRAEIDIISCERLI
jgi:DNA-binding LacI/PurR family transcriptional regulator